VFQPAECLGVEDSIAVALEGSAELVLFLCLLAAGALGGPGGGWCQQLVFKPFSLFPLSAEKSRSIRRSAHGSSS
jgi:hypothetical protein